MAEKGETEDVLVEDEVADVETLAGFGQQAPTRGPRFGVALEQLDPAVRAAFPGKGLEDVPQGSPRGSGKGRFLTIFVVPGQLYIEQQVAQDPRCGKEGQQGRDGEYDSMLYSLDHIPLRICPKRIGKGGLLVKKMRIRFYVD